MSITTAYPIFAHNISHLKRITFTVTNDLTYDQRMQRICTTVASNGYRVVLIGRKLKHSKPIKDEAYEQKRLPCFFSKGKLFYLEYNIRLLFFLLFYPADCYCAIDLDTILPNYFASAFKGKKRVYDAHELFTEQKEIITRPAIHRMWLAVEKFALPKFESGYTVNDFIVAELKRRYGVEYSVVRNLPKLNRIHPNPDMDHRFVIYQGAVNEGRSFETLIPAMKSVNARLVICGDGNFFGQAKQLVKEYQLEQKVELRGMVAPEELRKITPTAYAAVMLFEGTGLNQYQSLANRFFDYIMAAVPQICVDYPQYRAINDKYNIASLIPDNKVETIAKALNNLLHDSVYHNKLQQNCIIAREELNWQSEERVLVDFYKKLFLPK
jgi:hypothetical protein